MERDIKNLSKDSNPIPKTIADLFNLIIQGTKGKQRYTRISDIVYSSLPACSQPQFFAPMPEFKSYHWGSERAEVLEEAYKGYVGQGNPIFNLNPTPESIRGKSARTFTNVAGFHPERIRREHMPRIIRSFNPPR